MPRPFRHVCWGSLLTYLRVSLVLKLFQKTSKQVPDFSRLFGYHLDGTQTSCQCQRFEDERSVETRVHVIEEANEIDGMVRWFLD